LPDLSSCYSLSSKSVAAFRRDGHVLLRGVASAPEIAPYRRIIRDVVRQHQKRNPRPKRLGAVDRAFTQTFNVWQYDERAIAFVMAPRFAQLAAGLLGVRRVRLYHDQALFKEPRTDRTSWHQDQVYNAIDGRQLITMWMPLVDITAAMGTMDFLSGARPDVFPSAFDLSDQSHSAVEALIKKKRLRVTKGQDMAAGDVTFHSGWVVHGAPANRSKRVREVITIIYFADGARVIEPKNAAQENDLRFWLPGCRPGDRAASDLNPILYDAAQSRPRSGSRARRPQDA
jgi:ectoine hydroxylase-related dioxygenase (phytanoyl-CoA dioxygenase family)